MYYVVFERFWQKLCIRERHDEFLQSKRMDEDSEKVFRAKSEDFDDFARAKDDSFLHFS